MRMLLVEDNPADARKFRALLQGTLDHHIIDVAGTLAAAKTVVMNRQVDVVFLDLSLPDSRGTGTVASLRQVCPLVPIVVISGFEDLEIAKACVRAGAQSYVLKGELTTAQLEREAVFAVERTSSAVLSSDLLDAAVKADSLKPYLDSLEGTVHDIMEYLRGNHGVAAQAVSDILDRRGTQVVLRELQILSNNPVRAVEEAVRSRESMRPSSPVPPGSDDILQMVVFALAGFLCGFLTGIHL